MRKQRSGMKMSKAGRIKTKHTGVYKRVSTSRNFKGRPDECYDISYRKQGKYTIEKVGWKSEGYSIELAKEIRAERIRQARHGDIPHVAQPRDITMDTAWQVYDRDHVATLADPKTERFRYHKLIQPHLGSKTLKSITAHDLERMKADLLKSGRAPATVKHALVLVRSIYNRLRDWQLYEGEPPTKGIKMPKLDNSRWRWLTQEEAHKLLQEISRRSEQWFIISLISLHCGLRANEIFSLEGRHLDISHRIIHVQNAKHRARRAIMTRTVAAVLRDTGPYPPGRHAFLSRKGGKIKEPSNTVAKAVDECGLNQGVSDRLGKVVFHTFRHTYGSWLALAGWPLYLIAELMGHSTMEMTRRYSHLCPDQKRSAVDLLAHYFTSGPESSRGRAPESLSDLFDDTARSGPA